MTTKTVPCAACGKPANPKQTFLYKRGRKAEEYVPLCKGCWDDGPNYEAWDDKIQQRIKDRRAGRPPAPPKRWRVSATIYQEIIVEIEADTREQAEFKVEEAGVAWLGDKDTYLVSERTLVDTVEALRPVTKRRRSS